MPYFVKDPGHWREQAAEMRRLADTVSDQAARETLLATAAAYDRMAERAEKHPLFGGDDNDA